MNEIIENTTVSGEIPGNEVYIVADIRFRDGGKNYYFAPGELDLSAGEAVIVDTSRGPEYGICTAGNHTIKGTEIVSSLRPVIRKATEADQKISRENRAKEANAYAVCQQKIKELNLDMQLVSTEWAFDGSKVLFFFTSDGRVDFRELVKQLAAVFRTRIELRQIGVRDKAKMVGGLGVCGRPFCCREFLPDFQPVSIKMAKTQNLSLNPTKISGTCGRLMCCLKYEQDTYEELMRTAPKPESFVDTPEGRGTVTEVSLLTESVKVRMEKDPETVICCRNEDLCVLRNGKAKKNDPPIPDDYAPVSSKPKKKQIELPEEAEFAPVILKSEAINNSVILPPVEPDIMEEANPCPVGDHRKRSRRRRSRSGGNHNQQNPASEAETDKPALDKAVAQRKEKNNAVQEQKAKVSELPSGSEKHTEGGSRRNRYRHRRTKTAAHE